MSHRAKKLMAIALAMVMLVTAYPDSAYAARQQTEEPSQETTEATTEIVTEEPEEEAAETTTEIVTEKPKEETTEGTTEVITEESEEEETTEPAKEEAVTEQTTETASEVYKGTSASETNAQTKAVSAKPGTEITKDTDKAPLGVILSAGPWGSGHYKWYVNTGNISRHYIFCMERGKHMASGVFTPSLYSGTWGTKANTFRIAIALDYFKSKGGWDSESGYVDAQYAVWNQGATTESANIINYANSLWKLTELNGDRSAGSSSYSSVLTPVKKAKTDSADDRKSLSIKTKKLTLDPKKANGYDINSTIKLSGSAWKYFAKSSNWGTNGISVKGCYDANGKALGTAKAKASVGSDGNLDVHIKQDDGIAVDAASAVTVILQVGHSYNGGTSIDYLSTGAGNQTLAYDTSGSAPAYFAIKVYADSSPAGTHIRIDKVDEFGSLVDGAAFYLLSDSKPQVYFAAGATLDIEQAGNYSIWEADAPPGMERYSGSCASFTVTENDKKLVISNTSLGDGVTAVPDDDGMGFVYTVPNKYKDGDAVLHKVGELFVYFDKESKQFKKIRRDLENVSFELHATGDIYAGDTLLFSADQLITNAVLSASPWNTVGGHNASIDTQTDKDGWLHYHNLPYGSYYLVESHTPYEGYWVSDSRIDFSISDSPNLSRDPETGEIWINDIKDFVNTFPPADVLVQKKEKVTDADGNVLDTGKPLPGAEFTLYAHISNTNFDGYTLFSAGDTRPAVISRKNGVEQVVKNQWVPLDTVTTNAVGKAQFNQNLPYGRYLVVETYAPKDPDTGEPYALAEESYEFTHSPGDSQSFDSGALFTHTFYDEKVSSMILVRKSGEVLSGAETLQDEYGAYQRLKYETLALTDIEFEITDAAGNLVEKLQTNTQGEAKSQSLKPGIYYVKEINNGGSLKLDTEPKRVEVKENTLQTVSVAEVNFENEALDTKFLIHKTAEHIERSQNMGTASYSDSLYTYPAAPVSGVVFGIYAKNDIKNYNGTVIVKAGSCVGHCITDESGTAAFDDRLVNGDYYWKEIKTKDDTYIKDTGVYDFTVKLNGENIVEDLNKETPLLNKKYKGSIRVIKTDGKTEVPLTGVTFELRDENQDVLGSFVTDDAGEISVKNLPTGTYYLQEKETLKGYALDEEIHKIDLTNSNLDQVVRISNHLNETSITIKTNTTIRGNGLVHTGDNIWIIMLLFIFSLFGSVLYHRKELVLKMKQIKKQFYLVLFLISLALLVPCQAEAAWDKSDVKIEDAELEIDGVTVHDFSLLLYEKTQNQELLGSGNETKQAVLLIDTPQGVFMSDKEYEIRNKTISCDSSKNSSYSLIGYSLTYYSEQIKIPHNISLKFNKDKSESGNVSAISYCDADLFPKSIRSLWNKKLVITDDTNISVINKLIDTEKQAQWEYSATSPLRFSPSEYQKIILDVYDKNIRISEDSLPLKMSVSDYQATQQAIHANIQVYYGSQIDLDITKDIIISNSDGSNLEKQKLTPGYHQGKVIYELVNGEGTEQDTYIIGKETTLNSIPSRRDYRFVGWYKDKYYSANTLLQTNTNGYILSAQDTQTDSLVLYARWEYDVTVERNGVTYHIGPDMTATVVSGGPATVSIVDYVEYSGERYPVTGIAGGAFGKELVTVTLPDTINSITEGAFTGCSNLEEVYVNSMTLDLGKNTFPESFTLHAYPESEAYRTYVSNGYTGNLVSYASRIIYVLNGGTNAPGNPEQYAWKSMLVLQPATKEGCRFDGWFLDAAFSQTSKLEQICEDSYHDITIYAKFTQISSAAPSSSEVVDGKESDKGQTEPETSSIQKPILKSIKVTNPKKKKIKVTLKAEQAAGFEIKCSTSKTFKKKLTKTYQTQKRTYTIKNRKKGKTYYIKVRAYCYSSAGNKIYTSWSKIRKIKVQK